jgi:hypothetical protein
MAPWLPMAILMLGAGPAPTVTAVQIAQSGGNPDPRQTVDRERDKHHGTSGRDPDSLGSSTRPMPGEDESAGSGSGPTHTRRTTHHRSGAGASAGSHGTTAGK